MDENKTSKRPARRSTICENLNFASKEAFKRLRTNLVLRFPDGDNPGHIIGVTSSHPSEGKSTVSVNLAYSLAELGKKTLLVDCDMRKSSIHMKLNLDQNPGLSDLMAGGNSIAAVLKKYENTKGSTTFDIITGGTLPSNPSEILTSKRMDNLLKALTSAYDYIILDLPPVGVVTDAVSISPYTDGMLFVLRENICPRGLLVDCVTQLKEAKANILGFVINGALEGAGKGYGYGKYGKYGNYGAYSSYGK